MLYRVLIDRGEREGERGRGRGRDGETEEREKERWRDKCRQEEGRIQVKSRSNPFSTIRLFFLETIFLTKLVIFPPLLSPEHKQSNTSIKHSTQFIY